MYKRALVSLLLTVCGFSALAQNTTVEVFSLKHRLALELVEVVAPLAAPQGSVQASGGQLIVRATPERMQDIRNVINQLDVKPRQLLISVRQGLDLGQAQRSASVSGRAGNSNAGVALPPQRREDASIVLRDGNGNVIRGGASDSTSRSNNQSMQQLRVLEGRSAIIQVGTQRPVVQRRVLPSVGYPVVIEEQGFQDVTTGFRVLPRVHGEQFTLEISPQQANLRDSRHGQIVDVQRLTTTVSGPLGVWVDIGGAVQQQSTQASGIGSISRSQVSTDSSVLIKVEELP